MVWLPIPLPSSSSRLSFSVVLCASGRTYWREREWERVGDEPNHTTAGKSGPLINQSIFSDTRRNAVQAFWTRSGILSHSLYTWGSVIWGWPWPRPSKHTHNRNIENSSVQTTQFNIWTIWSIAKTLAQLQVNLSFLLSNSLKLQPHATGKNNGME